MSYEDEGKYEMLFLIIFLVLFVGGLMGCMLWDLHARGEACEEVHLEMDMSGDYCVGDDIAYMIVSTGFMDYKTVKQVVTLEGKV